ncbi:MAG: hypothetical protein IPK83_03320 [Planctomycetes bacterium]|nr:hypothetical protein [Planctomycetota bacterium]
MQSENGGGARSRTTEHLANKQLIKNRLPEFHFRFSLKMPLNERRLQPKPPRVSLVRESFLAPPSNGIPSDACFFSAIPSDSKLATRNSKLEMTKMLNSCFPAFLIHPSPVLSISAFPLRLATRNSKLETTKMLHHQTAKKALDVADPQ